MLIGGALHCLQAPCFDKARHKALLDGKTVKDARSLRNQLAVVFVALHKPKKNRNSASFNQPCATSLGAHRQQQQ